jgi:hypothetical protein
MEMTSKTGARDWNIHMVYKSEELSLQNMRGIDTSASRIIHKNRELKLGLVGDFDAVRTIEHMTDLMRPVGYFERIILDFSNVSRVNTRELYRLFAEMAAAPHFNHIEICIEGLQFRYWAGDN